ncbi:hypothetical protein Dsin_027590 [Dipteronia sinensis]|uniref:Protein FAR1-RELATED SEQUENCE n=1 Tax=Dipteronia sinensis TaxID=43782 RepID=A0AAD9ZP68_9ROSI|nr:hypothetical protein Dsin_027590 [Dipteronia sinensis]
MGEVKRVLSQYFDEIGEENNFLMAWNHMLEEYNVHDNTRLKSIFDIKEKWAYTYVRHAWSAVMKTTQLSESSNATLKDYLKSDLNVARIFMHFEMAVTDKRYKELEAKYDLLYRLVNVKINDKMLIQAREVYMNAIFLEFQHQFEQAVELNMNHVMIDGNIFYSVNMDYASKERHVKV